jgi:flagellar hook-associated protein 3 FlgL
MRVTDGMRYADVQRNLSRLQSQNSDAARQASTGLRIANPSDDPIAAAELARVSASIDSATAHRSVIQTVRGDADLAESTLAQAGELMAHARELAMQGANDSLNADDRKNLATEARDVRTQMLQLANARGSKGYLFSGSKTDTPAFDSNGVFQGDDATHSVDIGGSSPTNVNASGARAFTAVGGRDVFADLANLASALGNNDRAGTAAALDAVDASQKQIVGERAQIGLVVSKLDTTDGTLAQLGVDLNKRASDVASADPFEAYSRMTTLGQSLERAVSVSRQVLDLTSFWRT